MNRIGNFGEYIVACRLLTDGSGLPTFLEGTAVTVTTSDGVLILNRVPVFFSDVFFNDRVVVHGVSDVLTAEDKALSEHVLDLDVEE